jgi:hypothetical protein
MKIYLTFEYHENKINPQQEDANIYFCRGFCFFVKKNLIKRGINLNVIYSLASYVCKLI